MVTELFKSDDQLVQQLLIRARDVAKQITDLQHEAKRVEVATNRAKQYLAKLNDFLQAEGHAPVIVSDVRPTSGVGSPGNRSKTKPVRQAQWEGLSLPAIVERIVNSAPDKIHNADDVIPKVFEIKSPADRKMVLHDVRGTMQRGAKAGLFTRVGRGKYRAKAITPAQRQDRQERLVGA